MYVFSEHKTRSNVFVIVPQTVKANSTRHNLSILIIAKDLWATAVSGY